MKQDVTTSMLQEAAKVMTEATTLFHRYYIDLPKKEAMGIVRQMKNKFKGKIAWGRESNSDAADNDHKKPMIVIDIQPKSKKEVDKYLSIHNIDVIEAEPVTSQDVDSAFDWEGEIIGG